LRKLLLSSVAGFALVVAMGGSAFAATHDDARADEGNAFGTYLSARSAAGAHDMGEASRLYIETLDSDPGNANVANRAFLYTAAAGDVDEALKLANKVVEGNEDDRAARMALAVGDIRHGDYGEARDELSKSAKGPFTTLTLLLIDGWAAEGQGNTDAALKDFDGLVAAGGTAPLASYHRALVLDLAGRDKDADAAYLETLKASNMGPRAAEAYGRFLERAGRTDEAKLLYTKLQSDDSMEPITSAGLARIAAGTKPDRLVNDAKQGAAEGLFSIAAALNDASSVDIAVLYLRLALYLNPDFDMAKIVLADRFESLKKYAEAIKVYRTIPSGNPYQPAAAIQIAIDEGRLGQNDQAIADLKAIVAEHPNDLSSWTSLGDAYRADNKDPQAIDAYNHAIATLNPPDKKDWPLYFARAVSEQGIKDNAASEADLQTALKLSPEQPEVLNYLGYTWVDEGRNLTQAVAMLEKARALSPYDGYIVDSVGWAYFRLHRYQDASKTLQAAVLLVPGDATINEHLGDAYWMAGRKLDARFQWNHALAFNTDPSTKAELEKKLQSGMTDAQARAGQ
jgi:tetratricopeptide (TPR) repeat protein